MTDALPELQVRRKRLLWRARHRGMKEMDLMLGKYAERELDNMSVEQLAEFETLLEVSDAFLLDWLTGKSPTPADVETIMFAEIKAQSFLVSDYKKL